MSSFSIHDVRFRRSGENECAIVVYGETVGTLTRHRDPCIADESRYYVVHLHDDPRGPRQVEHRGQIRLAAADMLWERDLVPPLPPPGHPMLHVERTVHAGA